MFGGGLAEAWPFALVALHYFDGFGARYSAAVRASKAFLALIAPQTALRLQPFTNGTNLFRLEVPNTIRRSSGRDWLRRESCWERPMPPAVFLVAINETFTRRPVPDLVATFVKAANG